MMAMTPEVASAVPPSTEVSPFTNCNTAIANIDAPPSKRPIIHNAESKMQYVESN